MLTAGARALKKHPMNGERRRYVVLGAGGIGCAIGGALQLAGTSVVLIARGAQLDALRRGGLPLMLPSRSEELNVEVKENLLTVLAKEFGYVK